MGKRVFSVETERDKDLYVLSATLATCRLKRRKKECIGDKCLTCPTLKNLAICMKELPACDKLRVEGQAEEMYDYLFMQHPPSDVLEKESKRRREEDTKELVATCLPCIALGAFIILLFVLGWNWLLSLFVCVGGWAGLRSLTGCSKKDK